MQKLSARQRTLAGSLEFAGFGVHSALPVTLMLQPAPPDSGFMIARQMEDGSRVGPVPIHFSRITRTTLCTTLDLGDSQGLTSGSMVIEGEWASVAGIFPIKMKFELINPDGVVVASGTGYSKNEINPCCLTKLNFRFNIRVCSPGQWKLRIKNLEDGLKKDAVFLRPKIALTPDCP